MVFIAHDITKGDYTLDCHLQEEEIILTGPVLDQSFDSKSDDDGKGEIMMAVDESVIEGYGSMPTLSD